MKRAAGIIAALLCIATIYPARIEAEGTPEPTATPEDYEYMNEMLPNEDEVNEIIFEGVKIDERPFTQNKGVSLPAPYENYVLRISGRTETYRRTYQNTHPISYSYYRVTWLDSIEILKGISGTYQGGTAERLYGIVSIKYTRSAGGADNVHELITTYGKWFNGPVVWNMEYLTTNSNGEFELPRAGYPAATIYKVVVKSWHEDKEQTASGGGTDPALSQDVSDIAAELNVDPETIQGIQSQAQTNTTTAANAISIENDLTEDANDAIEAINPAATVQETLTSNQKLISALQWIRTIHQQTIEQTPIKDYIGLILIIGLAAYIIGRREG